MKTLPILLMLREAQFWPLHKRIAAALYASKVTQSDLNRMIRAGEFKEVDRSLQISVESSLRDLEMGTEQVSPMLAELSQQLLAKFE